MNGELQINKSQILMFESEDGSFHLEVRLEDETVWLTQGMIVELYQSSKANISEHIANIFAEGELSPESTVRKFRTVQKEGLRMVERERDFYNLDVIISVGYRVNSRRATQFRQWATSVLKEYIRKGYVLNDERMKNGMDLRYFDELQERLREIRLSERVFYQKIKESIRLALTMIHMMNARLSSLRLSRTSCFRLSASRRRLNWLFVEPMRIYRSWACGPMTRSCRSALQNEMR